MSHGASGVTMGYTVELQVEEFSKLVKLAGFRSDYALAKKMEVNRSTVARVVAGELSPGPAFIGGALAALAPVDFSNIFRIVKTDAQERDEGTVKESTGSVAPQEARKLP